MSGKNYVLFVYPTILRDAGMPVSATVVAACAASAFATLIMGLCANYPIAVVPGMRLGVYFTYTVCAGMGLPWRTALGAVFISGLVFFLLTVTRVREWIADGVPPVLRSAIGTSTVTSYTESAAGVSEGGRTGPTAVVVAFLLLAAVIFAPLVAMIPAQATAPVLAMVGLLMMGEVVNIRFDDFTEALPAFFTIIMMPLTYSIAQGLAFGFMSYTVVKLITGRQRENNAVTYTLTVLLVLHRSS